MWAASLVDTRRDEMTLCSCGGSSMAARGDAIGGAARGGIGIVLLLQYRRGSVDDLLVKISALTRVGRSYGGTARRMDLSIL